MTRQLEIKERVVDYLKGNLDYELKNTNGHTNDAVEEYLNNIEEDIQEAIFQEVETACIYYSDCFHIVTELGVTHWEDYEQYTGKPITDICTLAFWALWESTHERFESDIHTEVWDYYESKIKRLVRIEDIKKNGGFDFRGQWITNYNLDETARFEVDPTKYYNIQF